MRRSLRDFNASNAPGTCLWCGLKLRPELYVDDGPGRGRGAYGDGFFCGLRCAHRFAVALAGHGRRLQPKGGEQ